MDTRILIEQPKDSGNIIILIYSEEDIEEIECLTQEEKQTANDLLKKEISYIFFPKGGRFVAVQKVGADVSVEEDNEEEIRKAGASILTALNHYKITKVAVTSRTRKDYLFAFVEGLALGSYHFKKYLSNKDNGNSHLKTIILDNHSITQERFEELTAVVHATCLARDLVNEPQSYLSAVKLSEEIETAGSTYGFDVEVFDKAKIESLKMGGLLAVNRGSAFPPRFNILTWQPENAVNKHPVILVGKGIVYDTGGLSLKPTSNGMDMMKSDMGGAATVVGAMAAISKVKLPLHVIGLIPSTDNRPGNDAYAPGDVIRMYSGTTVEVMNTDAEGRLVLADALHFAKKYDPELVMDFATLTGSAAKACGKEAICYMGNASTQIKEMLCDSGNFVFERLIEFPLWKEYGEQLKSNIADLKNLGGPYAGMITAGKFLEHFTDYPWLHFDIAGPAYLKKKDSYRTKEGTGVGVRLLYDFFKKYASLTDAVMMPKKQNKWTIE